MSAQNSLLSFKQWNVANPSIPFDKKMVMYQDYLQSTLITDVKEASVEEANQQKESYKSFLRRLTVIYDDDPDIKKLSNLDLDDDLQLISAIPIFSAKIRDIAIFYRKRRKEIKKLKEKYSVKGTEQGLERAIKFLFLSKYSKDGDYFDPSIGDVSIIKSLKQREDLDQNLEVELEDLYNV
jgi:hypothetical protein